ncbi:MAG: hypothetical protein ABI759_27770 [Candidatus Solibacter sp.]
MTARCFGSLLALATLVVASLHAQSSFEIVTGSLPPASTGVPYSQPLTTTVGTCPSIGDASSRIDLGVLPSGISVISPPSTRQWSFQGTPTVAGSYTFTLHLIWTHARVSPFDHDCSEEAVKVLTLVVQSNQTLLVDRTQIITTYTTGQFPPLPVSVQLTSTSGAATFTLQSTTDSGGPWLSVSAPGNTTPAPLSISYTNVSGLAPGTYNGRVTITAVSGASLTIPVTLQVVTPSNVQLQSSPSSLVFTMVAGAADPPPQSLAISVNGGSGGNFIFQAIVSSAPPNGRWFTVSPLAAATPASLTVTVNSKDLPVATYNGLLIVAIGGVTGGQLNIPITLNIQSPPPPPVKPVILPSGVVSAASLVPATAPGTWLSIFGTSLANTARSWRDTDFVSGRLPISLEGVSVAINGKAAAIAYVSPLQLNVLAPDDTATGLVQVQVRNIFGLSDSVLALQQTAAPAFFQFNTASANYVAGTHADGTYLAGPALNRQGTSGTAAKPGETIVLYGTGFGATVPAVSAATLVPAPAPLAHPEDLRIRIGGIDSRVDFAGIVSPGLYQFNVVVPQVADGDQTISAELRGLLSQPTLLLTVQR